MGDQPMVRVSVDHQAGAAYIELSEEPVARTVEFDPLINLDLDAHGVVVGIEILGEGVQIPFEQLATDYHVRSEVVAIVRAFRPDRNARLTVSTGNDGATNASAPRPLASV